ncbi:MAG: rhodanese-related sulfurtransferase [Rickettsiales bacterium]
MRYNARMFIVSAFYKFFPFPEYADWRAKLLEFMERSQVFGTVLLAPEGVNGTISGSENNIIAIKHLLESIPGCAPLTCKLSEHEAHPFGKAKVKLKKELISIGEEASPLQAVGMHVSPEEWNALISRDDVMVLDARNSYETHVGTFKNAIDPKTRTFKQLAGFSREHLPEWKNKKIATYCTGGIRCEKFTAWLINQGITDVYHLDGGILNYLEKIPAEQSLFEGSCYVFDERTAVDHALDADEDITYCPSCGHSLTGEDRRHELYTVDKSCAYCESYAPSNVDYMRA